MSKHPPQKEQLFVYEDIAERVICPNCKGVAKTVIPATTVTYIIHRGGEVCVLDNNRGFSDGPA